MIPSHGTLSTHAWSSADNFSPWALLGFVLMFWYTRVDYTLGYQRGVIVTSEKENVVVNIGLFLREVAYMELWGRHGAG